MYDYKKFKLDDEYLKRDLGCKIALFNIKKLIANLKAPSLEEINRNLLDFKGIPDVRETWDVIIDVIENNIEYLTTVKNGLKDLDSLVKNELSKNYPFASSGTDLYITAARGFIKMLDSSKIIDDSGLFNDVYDDLRIEAERIRLTVSLLEYSDVIVYESLYNFFNHECWDRMDYGIHSSCFSNKAMLAFLDDTIEKVSDKNQSDDGFASLFMSLSTLRKTFAEWSGAPEK
jgi:hypothetical protein